MLDEDVEVDGDKFDGNNQGTTHYNQSRVQRERRNRSTLSDYNSMNVSPRKFRVSKNSTLPSYMNPTKSWAYKQTGVYIEVDVATSYIQQEMQRIHSSNLSNSA
jgi:hypothetical protein